ncbi:phosphomevalonate kinase [Pseudoclavibacter endophyticus]|uniref:phosphomevalonate kinase n=1 Tax=Pseudoclavibacter endophyticus TaxID=1778590 RepID=A0A6H9WV21_9MICO|nr:phosphomevalonate kinase [Pseudoclavibacter endophyticus]KAB1650050.1 phosphomevalonate kinase [Pseudoclavibacter endophyticus]GGA57668.1 phosphomevalonate kinase [Pseudoclavibacter endophyticus]
MIETRAPGKLFVAGEYAVVEPAQPSVLVAVDRYITVGVTPSEDEGRVHSSEYGRLPLVWSRDPDGDRIVIEHQPADYVMSAIATVDRLRVERGIPGHYFDLHISSELDDADGRKFGLGSSAAVTVAVVAALDELYGMSLSRTERFQLALLATITIAPGASGGDLAASTYGGWIRYSAPDRSRLASHVDQHGIAATLSDAEAWQGFDVASLEPPAGLRLLVGWTGSPASTERLVRGVRGGAGGRAHRRGPDYETFLAESASCVADLVDNLTPSGSPAVALDAIRRARRLLQALGDATGIEIETPTLRRLCDSAERGGAAGKPSGAGGGDCGIVLAPGHVDADAMHDAWRAAGIRPLELTVHPTEKDQHER